MSFKLGWLGVLARPACAATASTRSRSRFVQRFVARLLAGTALALLAVAPLAIAESVTGTGDVDPTIPASPLRSWSLVGAPFEATLYVGISGTGTLAVEGGGDLFTGGGSVIGYNAGANGTVTVTGSDQIAASTWFSLGSLEIGRSGTGALLVTNGGRVTTVDTYLGYSRGGIGTLMVTGVRSGKPLINSSFSGSGEFYVGFDGTGTVTVENGGTLFLAPRNKGETVVAVIGANSGSTGTVTVKDADSRWTIRGALHVGYNGTGTLTIANGGKVTSTFTVLGSDAGNGTINLYGDAVSGRGVLETGQILNGPGTATLNLDGGVLRATDDQDNYLRRFSALTLGANGVVFDSNGYNIGVPTSFSGSGGLIKAGDGTLTLTGNSTYTGSTRVEAGRLVVNGSLTSVVTLAGGTLGGSGTVGGLSVDDTATVAPGNSIGTLTVSGDVAVAAGATYELEINAAGLSDRVVASGSATLSGGTIRVVAESGNYAAGTSYTILTATGGVSGQFSTVTSNLVFLTPSLGYDSNSVNLTMTRSAVSFMDVAATWNQSFIAAAAEALGAGNPVYGTLLSSTADQARAGFDLLSGEAHAQAVSVMIDESRLVRETILGHLRGPLLTQAPDQVAASFSADLPGRKGGVVMPAPVPQPGYALWGTAFGSTGNSDADGNAASLNRRSGGALLGADVMLYDAPGSSLKVGVAGGYSQSRFDLGARLSTGRLESGHAALYAGARFGALRFDAGAAYSWSESDIRRQVQIRGFGDLLRLQRPGQVAQGFAELGYAFALQGFALEPFAQLALIRVSTDAGSERGGAAALRVLSSEQTLGFSTLGLRAEAQIGAMPLFARAMLGWRHGFGELTPQARTAFVAGTTPATVFAARIDREALVAEAGLDWRISQATAIGLTYSAAIGERSRDHALKGRVEMRF